MITELTPQQVVSYCRATLGLEARGDVLDDVLLSALLRRAAGILCPCSRVALRAAVTESLSYLHPDRGALRDRLETLVEDMIVAGDLLELSEVSTDDPDVKGTWVFSAPPSFIARRSGSIFLTGIAPDQDSFLPAALNERVICSRTTRFIVARPGEDLVDELRAQGLNQLPEAVWLRSPKAQMPKQLIERFEKHLAVQPICGPINGLEILDPATKVTYYRGRWSTPCDQTGMFVARRPQEFGAPLWSFVELAQGTARRIIDLPLRNYRWRACDAAWHLQLAIDYLNGQPQRYRRTESEDGVRFDFFSPLPLWAQRRLMILGSECPRQRSLLAYVMPVTESGGEENYIQQNLWLSPIEVQDSGGGVNANH